MTMPVQASQLRNVDSRIIIETERSFAPPLSECCTALAGATAGDSTRFGRVFWEVRSSTIRSIWEFYLSSPQGNHNYASREMVILWEKERGQMQDLADNVKHLNHVAQNWRRGKPNWGKQGIAVSVVGQIPATFYTGEIYDCSCCALVPNRPEHLSALCVFVESGEYAKEVRKLDQKLIVTTATLLKVPFDLAHWQKVAAEKYPHGLPKPFSSGPTQWFFNGHPAGADQPLQVAVARLLGFQWPRQTGSSFPDCPALGPDGLESQADKDGIVCIPPVRGEASAADRLLNLLAAAYTSETSHHQPPGVSPRLSSSAYDPNRLMGTEQPDANALRLMERPMGGGRSNDVLNRLLADVGYAGKSLETWLRDGFFPQHLDIFHKRPFIWHVWDGLRDGFSALINYHKLDKKNLETLIYTYLGDWITRCEANDKDSGLTEDGEKTAAAKRLKRSLELILEGEAPYDIFVRWKPLHEQPIGWEPDINDGVRMNIRPFVSVPDVKTKGAGILRANPKIKWDKDRGKEPKRSKEEFPWFWGWDGKTTDFAGIGTEPTCERFNDCHYSLKAKKSAAGR